MALSVLPMLFSTFVVMALNSVSAETYFKMPYNTDKWPEITKRLGDLGYQIKTGRSPTFEVNHAIKMSDPATADYNYDALYRVESDPEWKRRMENVLPKMAAIALKLPQLLPNPGIRVLRKGENEIVRLNQVQVLSLMANSFFCTFPAKEDGFPRNKFCTLFEGAGGSEPSKAEKLKAFLHYFERMLERFPPSSIGNENLGTIITYERRSLSAGEVPSWATSTKPLTGVWVEETGVIEDYKGFQHLQADFANKMLGGGILGNGATQEEIRFAVCPELLITSLLFEELADNEAAIVTGIEQFSTTSGYAGSVKYTGDFRDNTPLDSEGRRDTSVFAIDALKFEDGKEYEQYWEWLVDRELKKAFAAFGKNGRTEDWKPIATGNWGSGVFNGDVELKFLIQWMAASQSGRSMKYFTVGRPGLKDDIVQLLNRFKLANPPITVDKLYQAISLYRKKVVDKRNQNNISIFTFLQTDPEAKALLRIP